MAFSAREVIMVFRGQNYLSGALRQVGREVGALSRPQQLQQAQRQVAINRQRIAQQRALNQAQLDSMKTGSRFTTLQMRRAGLTDREIGANLTLRRTLEQQTAAQIAQRQNLERQLANTTRLTQMQQVAARRKWELMPVLPAGASKEIEKEFTSAFTAAQVAATEAMANAPPPPLKAQPRWLRGMSEEQLSTAYSAEIIAQGRLASEADNLKSKLSTLNIQQEKNEATIAGQTLASQKFAAQTKETAEQIRIREARDVTLNEADLKQIAIQRQLAMQMRAMPWERFQHGARYVEHAGHVLSMLGLIATATFGYFAKSAADFQTQATLAATQATVAGQQTVANVQKVARSLSGALAQLAASGRTLAQPQELQTAAYNIFSGITIPGNQQKVIQGGINLIKQFSQVYQANYGMVDFNDVVQAGITIINDFGVKIKDMPKALNLMQAAVRYGRMTMDQFLSTFNQAAPAAKSVGVSFTDMADAITFLSRKFPSIRFAATGYSRLVEILSRNSQAFAENGIQINKATGAMLPLDKIISEMITKFPKLKTGQYAVTQFLKDMTGSASSQGTYQARRALTFFLQDYKGFHDLSGLVNKDLNELTKSSKAAAESPGVAWARFLNQLRGLIIVLGQGAIPAVAKLGGAIAKLTNWFAGLSPHTQRLIGYIGALVAGLTLLGGAALMVAGGIASLLVGFRLMMGFARGGKGLLGLGFGAKAAEDAAGLAKLGSAAGAVSIAMGLKLGMPAAVVGMILFHKQIMDLVNAIGGLKNAMAAITALFAVAFLTRSIAQWAVLAKVITATRNALVGFSAVQVISGLGAISKSAGTATLAVIGLRNALLSIAGLVVTAIILIKSQGQIADIVRHATGATVSKEINPYTGRVKPLSFWQGFGNVTSNFITRGYVTPGDLKVGSGVERTAAAYREWLNLLGKTGSPTAFKQFSEMFKEAQLGIKSSSADIGVWLDKVKRGMQLTPQIKNIQNLNKETSLLRKNMFEIAHMPSPAERNATVAGNRIKEQRITAQNLAAAAKAEKAAQTAMFNYATQQGVVATKAFQKLYEAVMLAKFAMKLDPTPKNQAALVRAMQALQGYIAKAQQAANTSTGTVADMLTAATSAGVVATKRYQQLYNQLAKAQAYAKAHPNDWGAQAGVVKAQAALDAYVSKATAANKKVADNAKITFQDVMSGVKQMYDSFLQQEQSNFGTLFQGPWMTSPMFQTETQWGHVANAGDISKDMRQQITQYKNFNKMLGDLQRRGAPSELINQLRQLGPQATEQVKALTRMSEPEIKRYFQMFRNAQNLIHKQAMADLNKQLDDYRKYGRNIALQIVAGLKDENQALEKQLTAMIKRIFGNVGGDSGKDGRGGKGGGGGGRRTRTTHTPVVGTPPHAVTGRMSGGPVKERLPFLVGEKGQELFVPKESGRIITNIQTRRLLSQLDHLNRTAPVLPLDEVARQHGGRVIKHHRYRVGEKGPEVVIPDFGHGHVRRNRANDLAARAQFAAERAGPSYIRRERQKALRHPDTGVPTPATHYISPHHGGFGHWVGSKFHLAVRDVKSMPRATLQMGQAAAHDAARTGYYVSRGLHLPASHYERHAHRTPWQLPSVARGMEQSFITSIRHPLRDPFMTAMWLSPLGKFGRFDRFGRAGEGVTFYRGEGLRTFEAIGDFSDKPAHLRGRWFTTERDYARLYPSNAGFRERRLLRVRVPQHVADRAIKAYDQHELGSIFDPQTGILPRQYADLARETLGSRLRRHAPFGPQIERLNEHRMILGKLREEIRHHVESFSPGGYHYGQGIPWKRYEYNVGFNRLLSDLSYYEEEGYRPSALSRLAARGMIGIAKARYGRAMRIAEANLREGVHSPWDIYRQEASDLGRAIKSVGNLPLSAVRQFLTRLAKEQTGAVDLAKLYGPHTPRELKTFDKEYQLYKNAAGRIQYRYGKSIARAQRLAMKRRASTALQQTKYDLPEGVTHLDVQHARLLKRLSKVFDIAGNYDTRVLFEKWMGFGAGTDLSSIPEVLKSATKPYFINIPKFETRGDYLSALHELGHQAFRHHVVGGRPFGGSMARRTSRWGKELGLDFTGGFLKAGPKSASAIFEEEAFAWHNALKNARMLDSDSARNYARLYLLSYHDSALLEHGVTPTLGPAGKFFFPEGRRAFAGRLPMKTALAVKRHQPLNMAQASVFMDLNKQLAKAGFVDFGEEMGRIVQRQRNIARRARGVNNLIKAVREGTPDIPQGMRGIVSRLGRAQGEETQAMRTALDFLNTPLTDAEKVTTKAPGVWYHGTRRVFNRFLKRNKFLDPNSLLYGPGHYFTDDPAIAAGYARGGFSYSFTNVKSLRKFMERKPNLYLQDVKRLRYSQKFGHVGTMYSMPGDMTFPREGQSYIHAIFGDAPANVHMARLAVKNPFKIEAPVTQKTIDALKSTLRTQMQFRAGEPYKASKVMYGHRFSEFEMRDIEDMFKQAQQEQKIHHFNRHWFTNERLYHYLEHYSGSKAAVNKLLQRAGFDAIQHIGGKISGGKSHHVTIVFSGGQVRPGYWRGGEVPGMAGQAVDITAHAGETILTRTQKKQMGQNIVKSVSDVAKSWGGFSSDQTYNSMLQALKDAQPIRVTYDSRRGGSIKDAIDHIRNTTAPKPQSTIHTGRPSTSRHKLGYEQPGSTNNYHYSPTINMKTSDDASATTQARHAEYAMRQKWNNFHRGDR